MSNSNSYIFQIKKEESSKEKINRIYFNSVIGGLMDPGKKQSEMYEIDDDDLREQQENQIDQITDVSLKDKQFYKLWNKYINNKEIYKIYMKDYLEEFIEKNLEIIIKNNLKENLLIHLTCLFDFGQLNTITFKELINKFLEKEKLNIKKIDK